MQLFNKYNTIFDKKTPLVDENQKGMKEPI